MSDIHLCHKPPVWRSAEKDWYAAMFRPFEHLRMITHTMWDTYDTRLVWLVAGDIFHKWNSPPSLINFAMDCFSSVRVFAIPGQHDLPNHLDSQMDASPFYTLVKANVIDSIDGSDRKFTSDGPVVRGYGWNTSVEHDDTNECISMVHRYVWMQGCSYHGAPNTAGVKELADSLGRPKLIIAGDNHMGFWHQKTKVFNCGSLYRLNKDQECYRPRVGIVYSDLSVIPYYLDTTFDDTLGHFADASIMEIAEKQDDLDEFLLELSQMGRGGLDFLDAVRRYTNKYTVAKATRKLIDSILNGD